MLPVNAAGGIYALEMSDTVIPCSTFFIVVDTGDDARTKLTSDCFGSLQEAKPRIGGHKASPLVIQLPKEMVESRLMMRSKRDPMLARLASPVHETLGTLRKKIGFIRQNS
jgi:hypothetical protein